MFLAEYNPKWLNCRKTHQSITVIGQTPRQSISYILASTLANVPSMIVDQVATFICLAVAYS